MTIPDKSPDRIAGGKALEPADRPIRQQPGSQFESHMKGSTPTAPQGVSGTSPMELTQPMAQGTPTFDSLMTQAKTTQDTLGTVKDQLGTKNLKLKRSQSHLLRNKLTDAHESMQAAGAQIGVNREGPQLGSGLSAIDRFISYVDSGQEQMTALQGKLQEMAAHPEKLNAAQMLLVQVKMSQAQQAIEYSSALLGKVIDSIKTILNTQL